MTLKKIDCVMIKVASPRDVAEYYSKVFGLRTLWADDHAVGLAFPDSDSEIVLHAIAAIPTTVEVNYLVDDVVSTVARYAEEGCRILKAPFDIPIGKCAVFEDPFGIIFSILDMSKGARLPLSPPLKGS